MLTLNAKAQRMHFETGVTYHIYNQGNNKEDIFFGRGTYIYFLWKMRKYLLPYGKLISYCLMPNHFHWLFLVEYEEKPLSALNPKSKRPEAIISLNGSIGIFLRSYAQAFNNKAGRSGVLFRPHTKAKEGCIEEFITVEHRDWSKKDYISYCFGYIHRNPLDLLQVTSRSDWEFSSFRDYAGLRNGTICDLRAGKLLWEENEGLELDFS